MRHFPILKPGQLSRGGDGVTDLTSIHLLLGKLTDVAIDIVKVDIGLLKPLEAIYKIPPNFVSLWTAKIRVMKGNLDARFESFV
jgi:hypothetical protein